MDEFEKALEEGVKQNGGDDFENGQFENGARWAREWIYSRHKLYEDHRVEVEKLLQENAKLREALNFLESIKHPLAVYEIQMIARKALEDSDGEV